jgi:hypothetical protein
LAPVGGLGAEADGNSVSDLVQPTRHGFAIADRRGLPEQQQERGLESVLGVVFLPQSTATHAQDERAVASHQGCERCLVAANDEPLEQLAVAEVVDWLARR